MPVMRWREFATSSSDLPIGLVIQNGTAQMRRAREVFSKWHKPAFVMFSDKDPITRGGDIFFRSLIPSAKDQPEIVILDAGHFLQEDKGDEIAQHIVEFIVRT